MSKKGLGRGLDHLFEQTSSINGEGSELDENNNFVYVKLNEIKPNPYQPRKNFDEDQLNELADSIRENGIFQPILVRSNIIGYEIISGERRAKAAKIAGLEDVPVIVYDYTDKQMMEVALIENIQREDLNVVEEAGSYQQLLVNLDYTQEELSKRIGKSRSHISNLIRLLGLEEEMLNSLSTGELTLGHAKILVGIKNNEVAKILYDKIISQELSVRETERILKELTQGPEDSKKNPSKSKKGEYERLEKILKDRLGTKVQISGKEKGQIKIDYLSESDLERLLELLNIL